MEAEWVEEEWKGVEWEEDGVVLVWEEGVKEELVGVDGSMVGDREEMEQTAGISLGSLLEHRTL